MFRPSKLDFLTYVKDSDGIIYHVIGPEAQAEGDSLWVAMVYYPTEIALATRRQVASGQGYTKFVCHGLTSELPRMQAALPKWVLHKLEGMMHRSLLTGEEFLALPVSEIVEVYDAKSALARILDGSHSEWSETVADRLNEAVRTLIAEGIEGSRLGLFGGLQSDMCHMNGSINDLDIVIDGLNAYPMIVSLSRGNFVGPEKLPSYIAENPIWRAASLRRGQLSQFKLTSDPDTVVDLRIRRRSTDVASFPQLTPEALNAGREVEVKGALVIDASGSLSLPATYYALSVEAGEIAITTRHYLMIGAATTGDRIDARGILVNERQLLLLDAQRHYIIIAP